MLVGLFYMYNRKRPLHCMVLVSIVQLEVNNGNAMYGCFLGHCLYDVMMYPFHHWGDYQLLVCNSWMLMIWQPPESLLCAITRPHTEAGAMHK